MQAAVWQINPFDQWGVERKRSPAGSWMTFTNGRWTIRNSTRLPAHLAISCNVGTNLGPRTPRERLAGWASVDVTPFEIPLEFPRYRLSTGFGELGRVASLLQLTDVIGTSSSSSASSSTPTSRPSPLPQVPEWDRDVEHVLDLAHEGQRRFRAGPLTDVVRHGPRGIEGTSNR